MPKPATMAERSSADLPLRARPTARHDDIDDRCASVPLRTK
jgi:hypothetical protein